jgi:hypothetical protein
LLNRKVRKVREKGKSRTTFQILNDGLMAISRLIYLFGDKTLKEEVLREAYESHFIGYPRSIKMYKNLKKFY